MRTYVLITLAVLLSSSAVFAKDVLSSQNQRILDYIGDPVIHTPEDDTYSPESLLTEFKAACEKSKLELSEVYVDSSEFPFLIYGVWKEKQENYVKFGPILSEYKPEKYTFSGSVGGPKYFAVNITPYKAYPSELQSRINNRTSIRMSVLCDSLKKKGN